MVEWTRVDPDVAFSLVNQRDFPARWLPRYIIESENRFIDHNEIHAFLEENFGHGYTMTRPLSYLHPSFAGRPWVWASYELIGGKQNDTIYFLEEDHMLAFILRFS